MRARTPRTSNARNPPLVRGALRFVRTEADAQGDSDDTKTEDAETIGELEEEEGE